MAHILDSSVWVALFLDNDSNHEKASRLFSSLKGQILVPYCVVNEVSTVLMVKHSKEQADAFLACLQASANVILVDERVEEEIDAYRKITARISFTDCAVIHLANRLSAELATFDKLQASQAKKYRP